MATAAGCGDGGRDSESARACDERSNTQSGNSGCREVSKTLFLVYRNPGPAWVPGRGSREQPLWNEHAVFMDRLFDDGRIVLAGPYADYSRILLIVQASDRDEAAGLLVDDPWTRQGILVTSEVVEWTVFLDSRRTEP